MRESKVAVGSTRLKESTVKPSSAIIVPRASVLLLRGHASAARAYLDSTVAETQVTQSA